MSSHSLQPKAPRDRILSDIVSLTIASTTRLGEGYCVSSPAKHAGGRQIFLCCAAALMFLFVAGCGGSSADPTETPQSEPELPTQPPEDSPMPDPTPTNTPRPEPDDPRDLPDPVLAAVDALAMEAGVDRASITVVRYVDREWPTTALGCPQPGFSYAQVVTDGYEVHLEVDGDAYEYHTNLQNSVVLCSGPGS